MEAWEMLEVLRNYMSDTKILDELVKAMSNQEGIENFEYIARMWDIELQE